MFVFKAAVVGAGVMGGEIAQVIAAADVPVLLKDVEDRFVDAGLEKARSVTESQARKLVEKGKLDEDAAAAQVERVLGGSPARRATTASATSTSSSRPCPSAWRSSTP